MFRPNFAWRSVAVLGVAVLALAACGDGDGDGNGQEPGGGDAFEGTLTIGTILPQTGNLAFLGPPEIAGVNLAIQDINEAGGVWGSDVVVEHRDSGGPTADIAIASADDLIAAGAHAVIGAAASGISLSIIEKLHDNKIIQVSPANTAAELTTHEKGAFYFRTAPSDVLQGSVLTDLILNDGNATLGIIALNDAYGTGLADYVEAAVIEGGGDVKEKVIYDPAAPEFSSEVALLREANPDGIALITFEEANKIIPELVEQGLGADVKNWYMVDGNLSAWGDQFPEGTLEGVKGTLPGPEAEPQDFFDRMLTVDPNLDDFSYGPESYDATVLIALAAIAANSDDPDAIRAAMHTVSKDGEKCTTFADCKALLEAGTDIDYDGVTGPISWTENGDPGQASIGVYEYGADNLYTRIDVVTGEL